MLERRRGHPLRLSQSSTAPSKNHYFQSFNERVSKLSIDPISKPRREDVEIDDVDPAASFVRKGISHWKELNLSDRFVHFVREVEPLCDSLPQILYHQDRIMEILCQYLEAGDSLSLEPLLSLLGNLAHDLGPRFEPHFPRALGLVTSIASACSEIEVIEWSFSCLAWLFKFLSRLIVSDIRATYDVMAPLLGKGHKKPYIARFAAEALSFLLRKAALIHHRDPVPLEKIVCHALKDLDDFCASQEESKLFQYGILTLFANAIKGVNHTIHSYGVFVFRCLLEHVQHEAGIEVAVGVLVNLIHHTDRDNVSTLMPILDALTVFIAKITPESNGLQLRLGAELMFYAVTVREGSRIVQWQPLLESLIVLQDFNHLLGGSAMIEDCSPLEKATVAVFQAAPLDLIIGKLHLVLERLSERNKNHNFISFCISFCELGRGRFESLVAPFWFKYVSLNWQKHEDKLLQAIPLLASANCLTNGEPELTKRAIPKAWIDRMLVTFREREVDTIRTHRLNAYLEAFNSEQNEDQAKAVLVSILAQRILGLTFPISSKSDFTKFLFGQALRFCIINGSDEDINEAIQWPLLVNASSELSCMPLFLENIALFCDRKEFRESPPETEILVNTLIPNLNSADSALRKASLRLLVKLYVLVHGEEPESLKIALKIEALPLEFNSQRTISMHIRQLSSLYEGIPINSWLARAFPFYYFGLLTFKLRQVWDDAVEGLKIICESKMGEEIVLQIALQWLEITGTYSNGENPSDTMPKNSQPIRSHEFCCTNADAITKLLKKRSEALGSPLDTFRMGFESKHHIPLQLNSNLRSQALKVFAGIPWLAEKRSRPLVPRFLDWIGEGKGGDNPLGEYSAAKESSNDLGNALESSRYLSSKQDRRTLLQILGSFVNPRVLFQSAEVYQALLYQLTFGDADVQTPALKAILTWKLDGIQPYQENLLNILDDARFREEISVFLQTHDKGGVQLEHRKDLMPVLLRVLYGKVIARTGASSNKTPQGVRRRAVFGSLSRFEDQDIQEFMQIAVGPLRNLRLTGNALAFGTTPEIDSMDPRQQFGLMNMIKDLLSTLGHRALFLAVPMANVVLYCISQAMLKLDDSQENQDANLKISLYKSIRQIGIQCLVLLFQRCGSQQLERYLSIILDGLIRPRLSNFAVETSQSISGTLQLLSVWAASKDTFRYLTRSGDELLRRVAEILVVPSAKDEVKIFVLGELLKPLIDHSRTAGLDELTTDSPTDFMYHADYILECCGNLLKKSPSKVLLVSTIEFISSLSTIIKGSSETQHLLEIISFLLEQPSNRINSKVKGNILRIMRNFIPLAQLVRTDPLYERMFRTVSSLFGYFKDRDNRSLLCDVLESLADKNDDMKEVSAICIELNSYSACSVDEPDFERRLRSYDLINESLFKTFSAEQWTPIVWNMLFFIKDNEEIAIRSSASLSLRRFIEAAAKVDSAKPELFNLLKEVLLPALKDGTHERSEMVRIEYLAVMAHLVRNNPEWNEVNDMKVLLVDDDEEASFFNNILHIQQHRRLRALRRLASEAVHGNIKSSNIAHFLLPLLENFIFDRADDGGAHNLAAEAISTIGAIAPGLEWPQIRAVFKRYMSYLLSKPELGKSVIKLLGFLIDSIGGAASARQLLTLDLAEDTTTKAIIASLGEDTACDGTRSIPKALSRTMPRYEKLVEDLTQNLLPPLLSYLHNKDESTVSLRVPVAVSAVKLLKILPQKELSDRLPPLLTDVCHILRSRAQESRDMTRKTLADISVIIGSQYFGFILKELRSSLARGYQLHVLSFTVHSILVETASIFNPGDLDYCLPQLVAIIMDDIFGVTGKEKEAEEYISKMREVKSSKSFDSMELVAKTASIKSIAMLIKPVKALLEERLDLKTVKKTDELLRRIGLGLLRNPSIESQETLIFCFELMQYARKTEGSLQTRDVDPRTARFLVNTRGAKGSQTSRRRLQFIFKLTRLSLDILRTVLNKFEGLRTRSNLSGFLPIVGDLLVEAQEEVQTSALRLLASIMKVQMKELDSNAATYAAEALKLIKNTMTINSELAQAALKLISTVLREKPEAVFRDSDIAYLLARLLPDLEEPDRQGVTFNFLKSVLCRKVIITEVYETMDTVAAMMVTSQSRSTRDLARGIYFQFLLNYPQGETRLVKQLNFLAKNLDYKHVEGRQSVMEAVHHLLSKVNDIIAQQILGTFFIPLVMVSLNDDSPDCRRMAGALLKIMFERADGERIQNYLRMMKTWLAQDEQPLLTRASLQLFGILVEVADAKFAPELVNLRERLVQLLHKGHAKKANSDWEVLYHVLHLTSKLTKAFPETAFETSAASLWTKIMYCSFVPHAWVKLASAQLLGLYFADFAKSNTGNKTAQIPLKGSSGLVLGEEETFYIVKGSLRALNVPGVSEELATQLVKNLVFLGRFTGAKLTVDLLQSNSVDILDSTSDISQEEDKSEAQSDQDIEDREQHSVHQYIFERISYVLRREPLENSGPFLFPKVAAIQLSAALCNRLPIQVLRPYISTILLPLHNFTDPAIPAPFSADEVFNKNYKSLVSTSHEILINLQDRMGTTDYVQEMSKVRVGVKERREGRRVKRRIDAVAAPEKTAKEKKRKGERKRERRKEKSTEFRDRRRGW